MKTEKSFALLRIAFGIVWAADAYLKWLPGFFSGFLDYFTGALPNQPYLEQAWLHLWIGLVSHGTFTWALATAVIETLVAIGLLLGLGTRACIIIGGVLSLLIWTLPEGLGGPYISGATDISAGLIYVLVFIALWLGKSWRAYSVDARLTHRVY